MQKEKLNRTNKGITLIALIITIIVMLILVGVSVSVALNGGLFKTAQEAVDKTQAAIQQESGLKYNYEIAKATGEFTGNYDAYVLQEQYGVKIGDKVNYTEAGVTHTPTLAGVGSSANAAVGNTESDSYTPENLEWRVLGVNEEGQLELISTKPTTSKLYLAGKAGYQNVESALTNFCNDLYGKGTGAASARSLTAEDINKLGNFNPVTDYSGYGIKYTYKYYEGSVYGIESSSVTDENKDNVTGWTNTGLNAFNSPNWIIDSSNVGPYELENTLYSYRISDKVKITSPINMAELITNGEEGTSGIDQWISSPISYIAGGFVGFGVRFIASEGNEVYYCDLFDYMGFTEGCEGFKIRPVVTLKSNIQIEDSNGDGVFEIK